MFQEPDYYNSRHKIRDAVELKGIEFSINSEISETFSTTFSINSLEGIEDGKDKKNIEPDNVQFWRKLECFR
nr:MAG: hypothetical protein CM15mP61_00400 [Gammaproteobacteria bacterium]